MRMTDPWLLRWDTTSEPRPRLVDRNRIDWVAHGRTGFVAFQGYLFERDQVSVEQGAFDAALVASAYERWQHALFDKLRGGFALAIWDDERECVIIGRDAMGLVPCFYWWNGRLLIVSPSIDAILKQPEVDGQFNRVLIAEYLQNIRFYQRLDETFYQDIRRLPPAHTLSVRGSALSIARYWDPIPPGFTWATDEELSRFPSVLGTAVERCLSIGADSVALSGGFDSVSIAVMAAEQRRGRRPLHAVSLRFTDVACNEASVQTQVATALGMPRVMRLLDECLGENPLLDGLLPICRISPNPPMSIWQPLYGELFREAASRGLGMLMLGTGGDELYYVNMGHATDCLLALDLREFWRFCRMLQRNWSQPITNLAWRVVWEDAVKARLREIVRHALNSGSPGIRDWILKRRLRRRLPPWLARDDKDLMARLECRPLEVAPVEMGPGEGAYVHAMRRLPQSPSFAFELEQLHAWSADLGFRLLFPYFDRDLMELSLRMPPEHLTAGAVAKAPLRRVVAERLSNVAMSSRKVLFDSSFKALFGPHASRAWRSLGGARMLADLNIVEPHAADAMMQRYFTRIDTRDPSPWLMLSTELWLRARSGRSYSEPTTGGLR
jgi:asparagine synthase (glutamine-hydrolysing)